MHSISVKGVIVETNAPCLNCNLGEIEPAVFEYHLKKCLGRMKNNDHTLNATASILAKILH